MPAPDRPKQNSSEPATPGFFIETYAHDYNASRSARGQKIRPEGELAKAKAKLRAAKDAMRAVLKELGTMHGDVRWGKPEDDLEVDDSWKKWTPEALAEHAAAEAAKAAAAALGGGAADGAAEAKAGAEGAGDSDDDSGVDVEDVACSICGVFESTEDNDIIMCDRTNCFRAFHVNCADPPLTPEDLGGPDDDWFCHQCNCLYNCIEHINEEFEADYTETGWARVFAEEESDDEGDGGGGDAPGHSILTMDLGSGSDDDSDFGDAPAAGGGGDSVDGSDAGGGGDSVDDSDDDSESGCSSAVSDCSGDDPARYGGPPKRDREAVTTENIVEGPRKRTKVDYNVLNATFSDSEESDGGAYAGGK